MESAYAWVPDVAGVVLVLVVFGMMIRFYFFSKPSFSYYGF